MKEDILLAGTERSLLGIVTTPERPASGVALIILNAGVLPRVGPHRFSVKLARHAAAAGHAAVRFDLSGLGDSRAAARAAPHIEQAVRDTRAVLDAVERTYRIRRFAIFGICAGAEKALRTAVADERVAGVFMLDGFVYPTVRSRTISLASQIRGLTPHKLSRKLRQLILRVPAPGRRRPSDAGDAPLVNPPLADFSREMQSLVERGTRVAMVYSVNSACRYDRQMHDAFAGEPFMTQVTVVRAPEIDHVVTLLAAQERLLGLVASWLEALRT